jgi:hypothetical protein
MDHDARNLASYRPSEFRRPAPVSTEELLKFLQAFWRLLEPSGGGGFPVMQAGLLRRVLHAAGVRHPDGKSIQALGMSEAEANEWAAFLSNTEDSLIFSEAEGRSDIEGARCHLQVMARALLLLFLSTASAGRALAEGGYTRDDLGFWWKRFGEGRGLWDPSEEPPNPVDLWANVEEAIKDLDKWMSDNPAGAHSLCRLRREQSQQLGALGACELVAIWGLVP